MTDRIHALTVLLTEPIRDDDVEPLIAAIRMLRGVADVRTQVHNIDLIWAEQRAERKIKDRLWKALEASDGRPD